MLSFLQTIEEKGSSPLDKILKTKTFARNNLERYASHANFQNVTRHILMERTPAPRQHIKPPRKGNIPLGLKLRYYKFKNIINFEYEQGK